MSNSLSLTAVPEERRKALADKLKKQDNPDSDGEEEEKNENVEKNKKPPHISQKSISAGHTSNSVQEARVELERLEGKFDNLVILVEDMTNRIRRVEQVLFQGAERTGIRQNLRRN